MPLLENVKFLPYTITRIEDAVDDNIGAVIVEPIQGETGLSFPLKDCSEYERGMYEAWDCFNFRRNTERSRTDWQDVGRERIGKPSLI